VSSERGVERYRCKCFKMLACNGAYTVLVVENFRLENQEDIQTDEKFSIICAEDQ